MNISSLLLLECMCEEWPAAVLRPQLGPLKPGPGLLAGLPATPFVLLCFTPRPENSLKGGRPARRFVAKPSFIDTLQKIHPDPPRQVWTGGVRQLAARSVIFH